MSRKEVLVFAGTRPEIIKMAPVAHALNRSGKLKAHFCYTGQHRELAAPFLKFFDLQVDSELDLMAPGQSLGALTGRASHQIDTFLAAHAGRFAAGLVQGDTTTAFVGALVSFYHKLPIGHVEAGLRTASIDEPFPEELNRRLITRVARWNFAPTAVAQGYLAREHVDAASIDVTGNTGIDALLWAVDRVKEPSVPELRGLDGKKIVLVTAHRRENIGAPLERIVEAVKRVAGLFPDHEFVLPVHKNPAVERTIRGGLAGLKNLHLTAPLDYPDLVWVMKRCSLIMSDSGGIQEEAPSLLKPVLVLRNDTERPEAVDYGTSFLMGSDVEKITRTASAFLKGERRVETPAGKPSPYGDGRAAERITERLERDL